MNKYSTTVSKDNVLTVTFDKIKAGWEQHILLTSDRHWDSKRSDRAMQKRHLDKALEMGALIIDLGDLFDVMQSRNDRRGSKSSLLDELNESDYFNLLVEQATEWFKPYVKNWLMMGTGNHETAIVKHNEFNLTRQLVWNLNQSGGKIHLGDYSNFIQFKFVKSAAQRAYCPTFTTWYHHGYGGAAPRSKGVLHVDTRAAVYPDADLLIAGHTHQTYLVPKPRVRLSRQGVITQDKQMHIQIPSYKQSEFRNGWEAERGFDPTMTGAIWWRMYYLNDEIKHEFTWVD